LKTLALLGVLCLGSVVAAAQSADSLAAARVLGPQWKQMSRGAGMIFAGTVLTVTSPSAQDGAVSTVELKFRVDRAIAGTRSGQVLTIREWAGA
jgi:regulator of RNase E activity RraA